MPRVKRRKDVVLLLPPPTFIPSSDHFLPLALAVEGSRSLTASAGSAGVKSGSSSTGVGAATGLHKPGESSKSTMNSLHPHSQSYPRPPASAGLDTNGSHVPNPDDVSRSLDALLHAYHVARQRGQYLDVDAYLTPEMRAEWYRREAPLVRQDADGRYERYGWNGHAPGTGHGVYHQSGYAYGHGQGYGNPLHLGQLHGSLQPHTPQHAHFPHSASYNSHSHSTPPHSARSATAAQYSQQPHSATYDPTQPRRSSSDSHGAIATPARPASAHPSTSTSAEAPLSSGKKRRHSSPDGPAGEEGGEVGEGVDPEDLALDPADDPDASPPTSRRKSNKAGRMVDGDDSDDLSYNPSKGNKAGKAKKKPLSKGRKSSAAAVGEGERVMDKEKERKPTVLERRWASRRRAMGLDEAAPALQQADGDEHVQAAPAGDIEGSVPVVVEAGEKEGMQTVADAAGTAVDDSTSTGDGVGVIAAPESAVEGAEVAVKAEASLDTTAPANADDGAETQVVGDAAAVDKEPTPAPTGIATTAAPGPSPTPVPAAVTSVAPTLTPAPVVMATPTPAPIPKRLKGEIKPEDVHQIQRSASYW